MKDLIKIDNKIVDSLAGRVSKKVLIHSQGVGRTAKELALNLGVCQEKALLAGFLHDYARGISKKGLLKEAKKRKINVDNIMLCQPVLLHGPVGASLVKEELGVKDMDVLEAIACHTTGKKGMTLLSSIVYVADIIEPSRDFAGVDVLRERVFSDFNEGLLLAVKRTIMYVLQKGQLLHPATVDFWNHLCMVKR